MSNASNEFVMLLLKLVLGMEITVIISYALFVQFDYAYILVAGELKKRKGKAGQVSHTIFFK
jgi:hypothetical protein